MSSKKKVMIAAVCLAVGLGILFLRARYSLTHVEGYREASASGGSCLAMSPECGVCYGKVRNHECYVDKKKLSDEELREMNLTR